MLSLKIRQLFVNVVVMEKSFSPEARQKMAIKKGFKKVVDSKIFVEISGDLWVHPEVREPKRHKGEDRLRGTFVIPADAVSVWLATLAEAQETEGS